MTPLSRVAEIRLGFPFRGAVPIVADGGTPVIQSRDVSDGHEAVVGPLARTNLPGVDEHTRAEAEDVVLQSRGSRFPAVVVGGEVVGAIVAAPLYLIRPDHVHATAGYLALVLNAASMQARLRAGATGSQVLQVPAGTIRDLLIPLPPLHKQRVLADLGALLEEEVRLATALAVHQSARLFALAHDLDEVKADRNSRRHANAPG